METSNIKVNEAEKVDNTKITAHMLSEQERLSAQIVDTRKEITELTEAELKTSLDKGTQRKTTENELPSLTQCTA